MGFFVDSAGKTHGFVETGDSFTTVDMPGASDTVATGINDSGQITGDYYDNTGTPHGFVDTGGSFIPLDIANASGTEPFGIDGSGQPVGFYDAPTGVQGFGPDGSINVPDTPPLGPLIIAATPVSAVPEPSSLALFSAGLIGLGIMRLRRRA